MTTHIKKIIDQSIRIFGLRNPVASDLRFVFATSHISRDIERISANMKSIAKNIARIGENNQSVTNSFLNMLFIISDMLHSLSNIIKDMNLEVALAIQQRDDEIDNIYEEILTIIMKRDSSNNDSNKDKTNIFIARSLERIGDHIVGICVYIQFIKSGKLDWSK